MSRLQARDAQALCGSLIDAASMACHSAPARRALQLDLLPELRLPGGRRDEDPPGRSRPARAFDHGAAKSGPGQRFGLRLRAARRSGDHPALARASGLVVASALRESGPATPRLGRSMMPGSHTRWSRPAPVVGSARPRSCPASRTSRVSRSHRRRPRRRQGRLDQSTAPARRTARGPARSADRTRGTVEAGGREALGAEDPWSTRCDTPPAPQSEAALRRERRGAAAPSRHDEGSPPRPSGHAPLLRGGRGRPARAKPAAGIPTVRS